MAYQITLVTSDYRGDHAADVTRAIDVREGETVEDLVARALETAHPLTDHLELRVVHVVDPPQRRIHDLQAEALRTAAADGDPF